MKLRAIACASVLIGLLALPQSSSAATKLRLTQVLTAPGQVTAVYADATRHLALVIYTDATNATYLVVADTQVRRITHQIRLPSFVFDAFNQHDHTVMLAGHAIVHGANVTWLDAVDYLTGVPHTVHLDNAPSWTPIALAVEAPTGRVALAEVFDGGYRQMRMVEVDGLHSHTVPWFQLQSLQINGAGPNTGFYIAYPQQGLPRLLAGFVVGGDVKHVGEPFALDPSSGVVVGANRRGFLAINGQRAVAMQKQPGVVLQAAAANGLIALLEIVPPTGISYGTSVRLSVEVFDSYSGVQLGKLEPSGGGQTSGATVASTTVGLMFAWAQVLKGSPVVNLFTYSAHSDLVSVPGSNPVIADGILAVSISPSSSKVYLIS